ncbi:hypothetical protein SDC9_155764 [bioreactor metagenome]|uniref:Uncharacterized protein n=1 Tax=bioreactor metagenome TaxID=1076179 RepID=A0A645F4N8_9ZZZZ
MQDFVVVRAVAYLQVAEIEYIEVEHRSVVDGCPGAASPLRGPVDERRVDVQRYVSRLDLRGLRFHAQSENKVFSQVG